MNASGLGKLNGKDLLHGLAAAACVAVLATLQTIVKEKGFALTSEDGMAILNSVFQGVVGFLSVKFLTSDKGNLLGHPKL